MDTHLHDDEADLAQFGYRQELKRSLGVFSSFAVAFSYISPSTGIFALFGLGFWWALLDEDRLTWHDLISRMYQRSY